KARPLVPLPGTVYDMRARLWSAELGSFLSADEFAFHDGASTLWGWPGQNPLRWCDPSGRDGIDVALQNPGLFAAATSLGTAAAGVVGSVGAALASPASASEYVLAGAAVTGIVVGAAWVSVNDVWEFTHPTVFHSDAAGDGQNNDGQSSGEC